MEARISGQDYFLWIEREELDRLNFPIKLTTTLREKEKDLGKVVTLCMGNPSGMEGVDLTYEPPNPESWDAIRVFNVVIGSMAYNQLLTQRRCGARYDGDNKVSVAIKDR